MLSVMNSPTPNNADQNVSKTAEPVTGIWEEDDEILEISFPCEYFHQIRIRGDGHCMVHSVMETLQIEDAGRTKTEVMRKMETMLYHDVDDIRTFTNHVDTDPRKEMADYIRKGKYNAGHIILCIGKCHNFYAVNYATT